VTAPLNILFTSAGRRVELVRAFHRAYQALGLDGRIVVTDIGPLAPTAQLADRFCLVPQINTPDYISALAKICRREWIAAKHKHSDGVANHIAKLNNARHADQAA
jgi:carbamoyl-phosphate synthase large subunit